jgi:type I restriction enzyme, S subunit
MRKEKLSSLCKISNGFAFKSDDYVSHGYRVMRITNVQKGLVVDNDPKFIPHEIADKVYNFKLDAGDILVSLTGNVGRVGRILSQHLPAVLNQRVGLIRPTSEKINDKYLYQFLNSDKFEREAIQNSNGVAQLNLSSKWIENYQIPLPPLDDQIRIAHLLGKMEGLIAQRKQHLQQLDDLLKSVFLEMFGDPVRNYKNHKTSILGAFITHLTSGGRGWAKYYSNNGKRFIRSLDVQMNTIGSKDIVYVDPPDNKETERTRVEPGDILLTITGSKIGRVCFVPLEFEEAYVSQHVAIIRTKDINPIFLSYYLSMPNCGQRIISKRQYGQAKPGLNLTQISNFEILKPDIDIQNHFAAIVEKIEGIKSRYQQSLTDLNNLYGALSQQAFKGELDLSRIQLEKTI